MDTMTKNRMVLSDGMAEEHDSLSARWRASIRILRAQDHQLPGHLAAEMRFYLPVLAVDTAILASGWVIAGTGGEPVKLIAALIALIFTFIMHVKWSDDWSGAHHSALRAEEGERYQAIVTDMNKWVSIASEQAEREGLGTLVTGRRAAFTLCDQKIKARVDRERAERMAVLEESRRSYNKRIREERRRHEEKSRAVGMSHWMDPFELSAPYLSSTTSYHAGYTQLGYDPEPYSTIRSEHYSSHDDYNKSPLEKMYLVSEAGRVRKVHVVPEGDITVLKAH